jgi:CHAT domain-containing protein
MSQQQGQSAEAKTLYLRVLEMLKNEKEQNGLVYGTVINNLAMISLEEKNYEEALKYSKQAMDYAQQTQGIQSIPYIKAANNMLVTYSKMNQYEAGKKTADDLLKICTQTLGDSAQLMGTIYSNYASVEAKAGHTEKASALMYKSLSIQLAHYERNLYALSERDQVTWWQQQAFAFQMLPSLLLATGNQDKSLVSAMINQQLQLKGFVLNNAASSLRKARSINDPQLQLFIDQWQSARSLYLQQSSLPVAERMYSTDSLQVMANNYEQAINKKTGNQLLSKQTTVTWQQVQQSLAPQEAAVEFFRYPKFTNNWFSDTLNYGAIVITKNETPVIVSLGDEKSIQWCFSGGSKDSKEANISKLYRSKIKGKLKTEVAFTGDSLYKLIWQPLLPFLKGTTTVSYAPDGLLHKIAFAALPNGDGTLLLDSFQLQQYSSVRQLHARENKPIVIKSVFAEGHAAFNAGNSNSENNTWSDLPGTKKELETLTILFSSKGIKVSAFDSTKATEENLKALSNKAPSIIHIATHGFFLPDPPKTIATDNIPLGENMFAAAADPLMRSGIILAGANKNWNSMQISRGKEDGIVTAYEIAQLNLNGTALAVLSACETGLGDVQDAEGVFGLQRSLKMAGIKNLVLSLWEVPDEETMELMTTFYGNILAGKPVRQSFYEAQKAMRLKHPPFAWSAFVLME